MTVQCQCTGALIVLSVELNKQASIAQEYIDVSQQRLGRPKLDLLQFYW